MKLAKKIWLTVAIALVVIGVMISVVSLAKMEFDFRELDSQKYISNEYQISQYFNRIDIDVTTSDIEFVRSESSDCMVVCIDEDKVKHNVTVVNDTLTITMQDNREWYDHISLFSFGEMSITVHLPFEQYDFLSIETNTGDITIPNFTFGEATVETDTGDVDFSANVLGELDISTDTGAIDFENIKARDMKIESHTGDIVFNSTECSNVELETDTGDLFFDNAIATESIAIETHTGDINFNNSDGKEIYIKTDTGDVYGSLLSPKVFDCKSHTGDIDVPDSIAGGRCEILTNTGDIEIRINN